jgi:transposase
MRADGLLPVVLPPSATAPNDADADGDAGGTIVLDLGEVRVRIEGQTNAAALAQVLDRILR